MKKLFGYEGAIMRRLRGLNNKKRGTVGTQRTEPTISNDEHDYLDVQEFLARNGKAPEESQHFAEELVQEQFTPLSPENEESLSEAIQNYPAFDIEYESHINQSVSKETIPQRLAQQARAVFSSRMLPQLPKPDVELMKVTWSAILTAAQRNAFIAGENLLREIDHLVREGKVEAYNAARVIKHLKVTGLFESTKAKRVLKNIEKTWKKLAQPKEKYEPIESKDHPGAEGKDVYFAFWLVEEIPGSTELKQVELLQWGYMKNGARITDTIPVKAFGMNAEQLINRRIAVYVAPTKLLDVLSQGDKEFDFVHATCAMVVNENPQEPTTQDDEKTHKDIEKNAKKIAEDMDRINKVIANQPDTGIQWSTSLMDHWLKELGKNEKKLFKTKEGKKAYDEVLKKLPLDYQKCIEALRLAAEEQTQRSNKERGHAVFRQLHEQNPAFTWETMKDAVMTFTKALRLKTGLKQKDYPESKEAKERRLAKREERKKELREYRANRTPSTPIPQTGEVLEKKQPGRQTNIQVNVQVNHGDKGN